MDTKQETWPLLALKEQASEINYGQIPGQQPTYQRDGGVWRLEQEQLLIDSVLRKIDIPKIYLREIKQNPYKYEVVDGQQRIRALLRFMNDEFLLGEEAEDILLDGSPFQVAERMYSKLDQPLKIKRLYVYSLTVVIITNAEEDEVAELFFRLNNGKPLTSAEVRNAMPGRVTDVVRNLAKHSFFSKCAFKNRGKAFDQVSAQMLCLELNGGLTDISDKTLTPMYRQFASGLPGKVEDTVRKNLDLMDQMFPARSRLLRRATAINIYLLVSYLSKHRNIKHSLQDIYKWFESSEIDRLKDPDYSYLMTRSANSRPSVEGRFKWILSDFMSCFNTFKIVDLDSRRTFSDLQKAEIFIKDNKRCQGTSCGGKLLKDDDKWHADHIVAWINGGKTEVSNGQVLCPTCNLKKGSKFWDQVHK